MKRVHITGSTLRPQSVAAKGKLAAELRERVWPLFTTARLSPLVCARFALEEAWRAHELMESNAHIGKILLTT
jgi:NADPH2:quinone reductase